MITTSKMSYFQVIINHLLTAGYDEPSSTGARVIIMSHQHWLLACGYDLEIGQFKGG